MSMQSTIKKAVDKAFDAVGDLKKTARLFGPSVKGYNLTTGVIEEKPSSSLTVDIIIEDAAKSDDSTTVYKAIIKSGVDLTVYKQLKIDKVNYRLLNYTDNGFIINLNLARED